MIHSLILAHLPYLALGLTGEGDYPWRKLPELPNLLLAESEYSFFNKGSAILCPQSAKNDLTAAYIFERQQ